MRIIEHDTTKHGGVMFTDIIKFKIPMHPLGTVDSTIPELNRVCDWLANNFKENYVVMEMMDRRISGGWGDKSKEQWAVAGGTVNRTEEPHVSFYELRCYGKDATMFLLRWS